MSKCKYDELNIFINDLRTQNVQFNIICIQESWLSEDDSTDHLKLDNCKLIPQCKNCSSKGGLYNLSLSMRLL